MTAGGKNVAPAVLEDRLRAHALVSQCIVVGDRRPFIARAGHPRRGGAAGVAGVQGQAQGPDRRAGPDDPDLRAEIESAVKDANKAVSQAEAIRKFTHPRHGLHRGQRDADAEPEAQALRRHEGVRRRGRGALHPLTH